MPFIRHAQYSVYDLFGRYYRHRDWHASLRPVVLQYAPGQGRSRSRALQLFHSRWPSEGALPQLLPWRQAPHDGEVRLGSFRLCALSSFAQRHLRLSVFWPAYDRPVLHSHHWPKEPLRHCPRHLRDYRNKWRRCTKGAKDCLLSESHSCHHLP